MIEELMRETFERHETLAPAPEQVRVRIDAVATRRRRWRKGTAAVGGTAVALVALVATFFIRADALSTAPVVGGSASAVARGPMTILLIGTDRRPDIPDNNVLRSDTIMLAHLPGGSSTPYLISIPRDEFVSYRGQQVKLNGVFALGGAQTLRDSLRKLTGITINGAIEVDFAGLIKVTDAVGGVDLCVDRQVTSFHTDRVYGPGCRRFNGADAMDYLRQQHPFVDGDDERQQHNRQYVKALFERLANADLPEILRVVGAAGNALRIDLGGYEMAKLVALGHDIDPDDVVSITPPATPDGLKPEASRLWAAVRDGSLAQWVTANPDQVDQR